MTEDFYSKFKRLLGEEYILLDEFPYTNSHGRISVIHKRCGNKRTCEARRLFTQKCRCLQNSQNGKRITESAVKKNIPVIEKKFNVTADMNSFRGYRLSMNFICNVCGNKITRSIEHAIYDSPIVCNHGKSKAIRIESLINSILDDNLKILNDIEKSNSLRGFLENNFVCNGYEIVNVYPDKATLIHSKCGRIITKIGSEWRKGYGCKACSRCGTSQGVQTIERMLDDMNVQYDREVSYNDCRRIRPLPFDFVLYSGGERIGIIEFNGEQHYRATTHMGGEDKLARIQEADSIKKAWCEKNNIPFKVIKWNDDIEKEVKEFLKM